MYTDPIMQKSIELVEAAREANIRLDPRRMTAEEKALAEAEIRSALGLLFERNYIVEQIVQGGQVPASSFVAMGMTDADGSEFYKNANSKTDSFDGYYDVSVEAYEANAKAAIEILKKYYAVKEG